VKRISVVEAGAASTVFTGSRVKPGIFAALRGALVKWLKEEVKRLKFPKK